MSRNTRQVVQLVGVGLVLVLLVVLFLATRGGSSTSAAGASPSSRATVAAKSTAGPGTGAAGSKAASTPGSAGVDPDSGLRWVAESSLPKEARETLRLIRAGGPYPYPRNDDKTFSNAERILPRQPSGYYREYTVITPGSPDRGARRIIAGDGGELYYTADHYSSFQRIREGV